MTTNFPDLRNSKNPKKKLHKGILQSNCLKTGNEEKNFKAARKERHIIYRGTKIKMPAHLFSETVQARRQQRKIFNV